MLVPQHTLKQASAAGWQAGIFSEMFADWLLYDNGQVHARVNGTVQVISTGSVEGSNHVTIIALELHVHSWCAGLGCRFGSAVIPGAILNDVDYSCIVNQVQTAALADGDGGLCEVGAVHVNIGAAATPAGATPTRDNQGRDKAQYDEANYQLFHDVYSLLPQKKCDRAYTFSHA